MNFLILNILSFFIFTDSLIYNDNQFVSLSIKSDNNILKRGESFSIFVNFNPNENIKINADAGINLEVDKNKFLKLESQSEIKIDSLGYLKTEFPIQFNFKINPKTNIANAKIKCTLKYFFCSESEGWCNKFSQKFELPISIIK